MKPFILVFVVLFLGFVDYQLYHSKNVVVEVKKPVPVEKFSVISSGDEKKEITEFIPSSYLKYSEIVDKLKEYSLAENTELFSYGKTTKGVETYCLKVGKTGKKVLITAGIHGNERLCVATLLGNISRYLKEPIENCQVYFIPVVSPDSYDLNSRYVDGFDPNRNFVSPRTEEMVSVPPVENLKQLHLKEKFDGFMSGHSYGRVYLFPYGDLRYGRITSDHERFLDICQKMSEKSEYKYNQISYGSSGPFYGFEADWFYRHGCFSIVCEYGTEFQPHPSKIKEEMDKSYEATRVFIKNFQ